MDEARYAHRTTRNDPPYNTHLRQLLIGDDQCDQARCRAAVLPVGSPRFLPRLLVEGLMQADRNQIRYVPSQGLDIHIPFGAFRAFSA